MAELPSDAFFHIFSRMPVKSLARFRCVCKLWCKYIDDPYLAIIHGKVAMEEPMLLMHKGVCDNMPLILNFSHIKSKQERFLMRLFSSLNVLSNEARIALEVRKDPNLEYSYNRLSSGYRPIEMVLGSCNGLLLLGSRHDSSYGTSFVVIHPLRKELYELPPIKLRPVLRYARSQVSCGLGFDTCINSFKVVCVVLTKDVWPLKPELNKEYIRTMVHVLGTNTWREIPQVPYSYMSKPGVFVHGWLHWLADYFQTTKVITFDVKSEEFGFIDPPKQIGKMAGSSLVFNYLVDLCGELGYVFDSIYFMIEVWLLKNKEWVMHCRIAHKPHLPNSCINVLGCWNKDGDILLTTNEMRKQLFVYNLKSGILQKANRIDGHVEHIQMYRGSLFSIPAGAYSIKY